MAKPCTPHPIAQRVQFFKIETANVWGRGGRPLVLSLGGLRGILSFEKESIPLLIPREKGFDIASEQLEELQCLPIALPIARRCRVWCC